MSFFFQTCDSILWARVNWLKVSLWLISLKEMETSTKACPNRLPPVLGGGVVFFSSQHISNPAASQIYLHSLCCSACPLSFTHQIASSQGSLGEQVMWLFWAPSFMSSYQSTLASSSALVIKQRKKASENTEWFFFHMSDARYNISKLCGRKRRSWVVGEIIFHSKHFPFGSACCRLQI